MLPPFTLSQADSASRTTSTRQWLASVAVPPAARAALNSVIDATADGNRRSASSALAALAEIASPQLDPSSVHEMKDLATELGNQGL